MPKTAFGAWQVVLSDTAYIQQTVQNSFLSSNIHIHINTSQDSTLLMPNQQSSLLI